MFDIIESEKNLLIIEQDETKRKILTSFFSSKYILLCSWCGYLCGPQLKRVKFLRYWCVVLARGERGLMG